MNVNEVLAALAERHLVGTKIHPNDHVNASQSSNDVFPTAVRIAVLAEIRDVLLPGLDVLHDALIDRAETFADVVKAGRTHLMDASPITLGQEFGGYAAQIAEARQRLDGHLRASRCGSSRRYRHGQRAECAGRRRGHRHRRRCSVDRSGVVGHGESVRVPGQSRCPRRTVRTAPGHRDRHVQDRQRRSPPRKRATHRSRGDPAAGAAARFVDHAWQGQSGLVRSRHAGRRTSHRS